MSNTISIQQKKSQLVCRINKDASEIVKEMHNQESNEKSYVSVENFTNNWIKDLNE